MPDDPRIADLDAVFDQARADVIETRFREFLEALIDDTDDMAIIGCMLAAGIAHAWCHVEPDTRNAWFARLIIATSQTIRSIEEKEENSAPESSTPPMTKH